MSRPHSSRIQHSRRVLCHQFHPVRPARYLAPPHPPVVEIDRPVSLAQNRQHPEPHLMRKAQPHNQQHRRPTALLVPIDFRPLIFNLRHAVKTPLAKPKTAEYFPATPIIINRLQILSDFRPFFTQFFPFHDRIQNRQNLPRFARRAAILGSAAAFQPSPTYTSSRSHSLFNPAPPEVQLLPSIFCSSNRTPTYMVHSSHQPKIQYASSFTLQPGPCNIETPPRIHEGMVSPFAET